MSYSVRIQFWINDILTSETKVCGSFQEAQEYLKGIASQETFRLDALRMVRR